MNTSLRPALWFAAAALLLLAAYLPTLQSIPNGSEHYYMIDVGETQIVLNVWGTLHATGYPLYVMLGSALTAALRWVGTAPAAAPAVTSMMWGFMALTLLYALALRLTRSPLLSAAFVVLLGLTRTVWVHFVIAEIYSFGLLILAGLLLLALWTPPIKGRLYWLALLGGIAVAHHRALAMAIPALVFAAWGDLRGEWQRGRLLLALAACLALGLIGFAQYIYLPLRANAGAAWVYGEPGNWPGLWDQFIGREAERFIGTPGTLEGLAANIASVTHVLATDLTPAGIIAGLAGLVIALRDRQRRRAAVVLLLNGGVALAFHYIYYTDILSALILPAIVTSAFGWLFLAEAIFTWAAGAPHQVLGVAFVRATLAPLLTLGAGIALAAQFYAANSPFIGALTSDPGGQQTIALARQTPPGSALMIAWGPRHFAAGFARDVLGTLPDITLVSHKANFRALTARMPLYTPSFTFYRYPVSWWQEQMGVPVYLHAAAQDLVEVSTVRETGRGERLNADVTLSCDANSLTLHAAWYTPVVPDRDLSVFVHLRDAAGVTLAQGDQAAPVFGWRPLTTWTAGEVVRDVYTVPRLERGSTLAYGLYAQREDGTFENVFEGSLPVECEG